MNDELLVKYLLDEATEGEQQQVVSWLSQSTDNRKYYNDFELIWHQSRIRAQSSTVDENAAWERFQQKIRQKSEPAPVIRRFHFSAVAAAILVAITVFTVVYLAVFKTPDPVMLAANDVVVKDTLPDNSVVTLNKNSTLSYEEDRGTQRVRKVKLDGEAFFNVAPDKSKPFIVEVDSVIVRVVGTSFNVRKTAAYTEVIVESGVVQVTAHQQNITLIKGESIRIGDSGIVQPKNDVKDALHQYYRTREFVCDNTPLWKLVEVLNEAYGSHITIANDALRQYPLTTTFHNEPLDNILLIIHETFDIEIERKGDQILLR